MNRRFAAAYFIYHYAYCIVFTFSSSFFHSLGYSALQIGLLASLSGLAILPLQPLLGFLADRVFTAKQTGLFCIAVSIPLTLAFFLTRNTFVLLLAVFALIALFEKTVGPLMDSWISAGAMQGLPLQYGMIRGMGSLGAAVSSLLSGMMADRFGFGVLFAVQAGCLVLCGCILFTIPAIRAKSPQDELPDDTPKAPPLSRNTLYWSLIAAMTFVQMGMVTDMTYFPVMYELMGGTKTQLGWALFLLALSEMVGMLLYRGLRRRFSGGDIMLASMVLYALRFMVQYRTYSLLGITLLQLTQGITFGLYIPSMIENISTVAGHGRTATAITICFAAQAGLGTVCGNMVAGLIADRYEVRAAYLFAIGCCVMAALIHFFAVRMRIRRNPALVGSSL